MIGYKCITSNLWLVRKVDGYVEVSLTFERFQTKTCFFIRTKYLNNRSHIFLGFFLKNVLRSNGQSLQLIKKKGKRNKEARGRLFFSFAILLLLLRLC